MSQHYWIGLTLVLVYCFLGVQPRPSSNESTLPTTSDETTEIPTPSRQSKESGLPNEQTEVDLDATKDILDKIQIINEGLKMQEKKHVVSKDRGTQRTDGASVDKDTMNKITQLLLSNKLQPFLVQIQDINNFLSHENNDEQRYESSKALNPFREIPHYGVQQNQSPNIPGPLPYLINLPVLVLPPQNLYNGYPTNVMNSNLNSIDNNSVFQSKQTPTLPTIPFLSNLFSQPFQWPFGQMFPILIKDPFLGLIHGGGLNNFVEYGQSADVCNRKQKSIIENQSEVETLSQNEENFNDNETMNANARQDKGLQKGIVSQTTNSDKNGSAKKLNKIFTVKPITQKPLKSTSFYIEEATQDTKTANNDESGLRFPFGGDFGWFGNKKPVAPSPGFFINKLRVRKGGVAIAGPGGVATAGRGGTAIVGPGGLAYTKPGSLAVAGPAARIIALSPEADLGSVITRLREQTIAGRSGSQLIDAIPEGKLVATGPIVYYNPNERIFHWLSEWINKGADVYQNYNDNSIEDRSTRDYLNVFQVHLGPVANAVISNGVAIANPISRLIIAKGRAGSVSYSPVATAVAGPGGLAHAESDFDIYEYISEGQNNYVASIEYLPFYGGAKGQYLEVKTDAKGAILSEKVVSEDEISSDSVIKNKEENVVSKVFAANLKNLQSITGSLRRLYNLGRNTGSLNGSDKSRFSVLLSNLAETASSTIKIVEEIGDNVDSLFLKKSGKEQYGYDVYDDVEEADNEGVGVDSPVESDDEVVSGGGATIAEAKPVGLAVIGESGTAASRPHATAVAVSGVAFARPIATAVAGIDPTLLGINYQVNKNKDGH